MLIATRVLTQNSLFFPRLENYFLLPQIIANIWITSGSVVAGSKYLLITMAS